MKPDLPSSVENILYLFKVESDEEETRFEMAGRFFSGGATI